MGRTGQPALALGVAAVLVAAAGTAVVFTRGEPPVANAATELTHVKYTTLITPGGAVSPAHDGQRVPDGDVVRTAHTGSAQLVTRGRIVSVGPAAAVAVIDGARQQLRSGNAVVNAEHGPGLALRIADDVLTVPDGSATEATRGVTVLVGSLAGPSRLTSSAARHLTIPALAQALVSGDALPASTTALHLQDHGPQAAAVAQAVPTLVSDDVRMNTLAHGINSSGTSTADVIQASWSGPTATWPRSTPRSDDVLPMVIADATSAAGGTPRDRYDHIVDWRRQGGSWGVIVELLSSHASSVETTFASLQHHQHSGQLGNVRVQALAAPNLPGASSHPSSSTSSPPTSLNSPPPTSPSSGGHHGGSPNPKPTPTQSAVNKVVGTVGSVVSTVVGLLPKPKPSSSSGLGGLLGH
jgi:hypothetical protein